MGPGSRRNEMFKNQKLTASAAISASLLILLGLADQAYASKQESNKVEDDKCGDGLLIEKSNELTTRFAQVEPNARNITIVAESARVEVKRVAGASQIILSSNCPRNWCVRGNLIRQAGFSGERKGSALLADSLGSRAIVNGRIYLLPPSGMSGLKLGPDGAFVNGQALEPLKGSDIPGNCGGQDYLEVTVPQSYGGDLKVAAGGESLVSVDSWKDGVIECVMVGSSSFKAGKLESLPKAAFDNRGSGSADIAEIDARVFVANIKGHGSLRVKKGNADMSNATVEGNGSIELHGNFKKLQKLVDGAGKIEVQP